MKIKILLVNDHFHFGGGGDAVLQFEADIFWGNITSALRWNRALSKKLFGNLTLTYSDYRFSTGFAEEFIAVLTQFPDMKIDCPHFMLSSIKGSTNAIANDPSRLSKVA